jgi:hypothetical protein
MRTPTIRTFAFAALAAALALAGCNRGGEDDNLSSLDNQLTNEADPALTAALQDQIAVDPNLAQQSNRNAVRPPETPTSAPYPTDTIRAPEPTPAGNGSGAGAAGPAKPGAQLASAPQGGGGSSCTSGANFHYNNAWAQRLPAAFPFYPNGKLTEAAANNANGCSTRVVSFTTADNFQRVLDWYHTRAVRSGYSSEHEVREGDHILAGANSRDGGAFYLIVTPRGNASEVALIVNNGR